MRLLRIKDFEHAKRLASARHRHPCGARIDSRTRMKFRSYGKACDDYVVISCLLQGQYREVACVYPTDIVKFTEAFKMLPPVRAIKMFDMYLVRQNGIFSVISYHSWPRIPSLDGPGRKYVVFDPANTQLDLRAGRLTTPVLTVDKNADMSREWTSSLRKFNKQLKVCAKVGAYGTLHSKVGEGRIEWSNEQLTKHGIPLNWEYQEIRIAAIIKAVKNQDAALAYAMLLSTRCMCGNIHEAFQCIYRILRHAVLLRVGATEHRISS